MCPWAVVIFNFQTGLIDLQVLGLNKLTKSAFRQTFGKFSHFKSILGLTPTTFSSKPVTDFKLPGHQSVQFNLFLKKRLSTFRFQIESAMVMRT